MKINAKAYCYIKTVVFLLLLLANKIVSAQLTVSKKYTPFGIVDQVLKGKGVEVSNVSFTGASNAIGTFQAINTNLGIKDGIILSTGSVFNAIGPNKEADKSTNFNKPGYPLLGGSSLDAAILEFDFTPQGDTLEFQYVFASEEYPEYVNQEFNDVFGFFISGPGISGIKNIALLPDGNTVAINNVNQFKNSKYYISNENGMYIEYDGFTTVLTARAIVQCGKTYHLVMAIADVKDRVYDSAIFLSAKSLSVPTKFVAKTELSNYFFDDSLKMNEQCTSGKIQLSRPDFYKNNKTSFDISISGSAIVNKDISNTIPKNLTFNPGELVKEISFDALYDKELDSLDSLIITFSSLELCQPILVKFYIANVDPLSANLKNDTVFCKGTPIVLKPEVNGGLNPYTFAWSTGSFADSIIVSPIIDTQYSVTVNDNCFKVPINLTSNVVIPKYVPLSILPISDITEICPYKPTFINVKPLDGGGGYSYSWFQNGIQFSDQKLDTIKPDKTSEFRVLITDRCKDTNSTSFNYTITSPPLRTNIKGDSAICFGDSTMLTISASGGYGNYSYRWLNLSDTLNTVYVNPLYSSWIYTFTGDECKTFEIKDSVFIKVLKPTVDFEVSGEPIIYEEIDLLNSSDKSASFKWFVDGRFYSSKYNEKITFSDSANHNIKLLIEDSYGCKNDTSKFVMIFYPPKIFVPNAFTPNGNLYNNIFYPVLTSIKEMDFTIYNRWGEMVFYSNDLSKSYWDGTFKGHQCPNDVYIYKLKTTSVTNEKKEDVGHVSLIR